MWSLLSSLALASPSVELQQPGDEPRTPLRYRWAEGTRQLADQTSTTHSRVALGGLLPDPPPGTATQTLAFTVRATAPDRVRLELTDATMSTTTSREGPDPARLVGLAGELTLSDRGEVVDATWSPPGEALSEPEQRRLQALQSGLASWVVLPEEPVGPGAVWRTHDALDVGGLTIEVAQTWELLAVTDDVVELRVHLDGSAAPSEIVLPAFRGRVDALSVAGTHAVTLRLDHPLPVARTGTTETHLEARGNKGLVPIKATMDLRQEVTTSAPALEETP
jgi:hypothetical protein